MVYVDNMHIVRQMNYCTYTHIYIYESYMYITLYNIYKIPKKRTFRCTNSGFGFTKTQASIVSGLHRQCSQTVSHPHPRSHQVADGNPWSFWCISHRNGKNFHGEKPNKSVSLSQVSHFEPPKVGGLGRCFSIYFPSWKYFQVPAVRCM